MSLCVRLGRHRTPDSAERSQCSRAPNHGLSHWWMAKAVKVIGALQVKGYEARELEVTACDVRKGPWT